MEIIDHTGCHDVTIFDEVGEKLLGCKANFLFELFKKVSFFFPTHNYISILSSNLSILFVFFFVLFLG